ncbi:vWA domain-containing protein [Paraliomyxa miuraensis]|uniref:vWA domain-containing protein n=1 Tax=Paraliomyxa miuraensis TaxID=376150 RepID=UPI0022597F0A|nr:VWA domain-containing protein [Paraliomyxa miuraensis]MCX4242736.1 VWA domain-containing protein [Paraliomyxa miuraensis]
MQHRKIIALLPATTLWLSAVTGCDRSEPVATESPVATADRSETRAEDAKPVAATPTQSQANEDGRPPVDIALAPSEPQAEPEEAEAPAADEAARPQPSAPHKKSKSSGGRAMPGAVGALGNRKGLGAPGFDRGSTAWAPPPVPDTSAEAYDHTEENAFVTVADDPRSTFSIDVDTASYSNVRRFLQDGTMPPPDAVRVEEMINYFAYDYRGPEGSEPFSLTAEAGECPWNETHRLVHVGLQGKIIDQSDVPARNLVFLFDVSGSMNSPDKLPLLKRAFSLLADNLRPQDTVSIVVYAGASGVVLEPTSEKAEILAALDRLEAGGSTNGGAGIHSAYAMAQKGFIQGGINRVILATDGDFNVGTTSEGDLVRLIEDKRKSGVFLSVLGFGTGNLKDATMEKLADKGNGNYAYIDTIDEARKVLVEEAGATLVTIAKDVKIQVEFNPAEVASYRLVGYENRKLAHADFNDDTKDAGEIGAGHSVTAIYEIVPAGSKDAPKVDALKYQDQTGLSAAAGSGELMTVKVRYKEPAGNTSKLLSFPIEDSDATLADASRDFRFSAAVAGFGMLLRSSEHKGDATWAMVRKLAEEAKGSDPHGRRAELVRLVDTAARLSEGGTVVGWRGEGQTKG